MDIRLLKYAREIARHQSFTKAASHLNIAQPSLSQQIAKLERDLGVRLFVRERRKVTPTPEGIRFLKKADRIITLHDDLEREMRERSEGMGNDLIIGTTVITGGYVLPPLLRAYREAYPKVQVRLVEEATEKLIDLTVKRRVDFSLLALPVTEPQLTTKTMFTEPLFLALPRTNQQWLPEKVRRFVTSPAGDKNTLALKDLSQAPFILLKKGFGFRQTTFGLCAENGFQPQIAYETSSIQTALSLVTYGLGVTLVPEMVARHNPGPLYAALDSQPTRTLVFAYHQERYLSMAARAFLDTYFKQ